MLTILIILFCGCPLKALGISEGSGIEKGFQVCGAYGYKLVEAKFSKENHLLCLKMNDIRSSPLTRQNSALFLDTDENINSVDNPFGDIKMAYGFPVADPASGSAEGYIGEDQQFYGVLYLKNRTLHADPHGRDDLNKYFGAYENDNMAAPRRRRDHVQVKRAFYEHNTTARDLKTYTLAINGPVIFPYFPYNIENHKQKAGIATSRICDLLLLADKEFYVNDANSSLQHVVMRMLHAVGQADVIFRNADFDEDGIPDNIGFSVKYILILTSNETNSRVFGDLNTRDVDGRSYLMRFARLRRLSEVCLGVAFSGHAFYNRTLGLSFTSLGGGMGGAAGGLCDRRAYGRSFNTLAIAHATTDDKERVPERIAALTLAHEMGHSFGAHHDDNFPNPECRGYLMGSQSSTLENGMNFEFSLCSKRLIAATLSSMSYCLTEENRPYCGNGIVEEGEACDCGLPSRCSHRDPCCTPRAGGALIYEEGTLHKEGCSVAPTADCHPSQGLCCTTDCKHADLTTSGINCKTQDLDCSCIEESTECKCGLGGRCLADGSCHAAECALLGLKECQCTETGLGGKLREANKCGVCCKLSHKLGEIPLCVGAEIAALEILKNISRLPDAWPHYDFIGPNVTVRACVNSGCNETRHLRGWPVGGVCVSLNTVGVCAHNGVCRIAPLAPRSNFYPDIMNIKQMSQHKGSTARTKPAILLCILSCIFNYVSYYERN